MKFVTIGRRRRRAVAGPVTPGPLEVALAPAYVDGRWRVPDKFNFTRDVVEVLAADSKRPALTVLGTDGVIDYRTFRQVADGSARWAIHLRENGVDPGDPVLVLVGKTLDWLEIMLAGIKVGAVLVPCPETLPAAAIDIRVASTHAKHVVATRSSEIEIVQTAERPTVLYVDEAKALIKDHPTEAPTHDTSTKDPAFVLSTSGTASGPRGVSHTHGSAYSARAHAEHWLDAGPGDAVWCTADSGSAQAIWSVLLGPWSRGAEVVLHEGAFDPVERLDLIRRLDTTVLCQPPAEYRALVRTGQLRRYRPHRLRRMVSTGDHLDQDVVDAFEKEWGLTILDGYGQAEVGTVVANGIGDGLRSGALGLPLPGYEVAVVDEQGNVLVPGAAGEIAVRGRPPSMFAGYWDSPDETKATFRGDWYLTGDLGWADEDGFIWLLGRAGDVITSGSERFGPVEIEDALVAHASVEQAAVVGVRDLALGGQYVRAFVVLRAGTEGSDRLVAELRESVRETIPDHKVPREIEFVDELPTTANGKVRRNELRSRPAVGSGPMRPPAPAPAWAPEPDPAAESLPEPPVEESPLEVPAFEVEAFEVAAFEAPVLEEPAVESPVLESPVLQEPMFADPVLEASDLEEPLLAEPAELGPELPAAPEPPSGPGSEAEPSLNEAARTEVEPESKPDPLADLIREPAPEPAVPEAASVEIEPEPEAPDPLADLIRESTPEPAIAASLPELTVEPEPAGPDPLADLIREPTPEPAIAANLPEPAAEPASEGPDPLADLIRLPGEESEPVVDQASPHEPEPEPEPEIARDPLADLIRRPEAPAPESSSSDASLTELGLPPVTDFPRKLDGDEAGAGPKRERRPRSKPVADQKERRRRSAREPGDDVEEVDWMQGLSSRLSAYSLADDDGQADGANGEENDAESA